MGAAHLPAAERFKPMWRYRRGWQARIDPPPAYHRGVLMTEGSLVDRRKWRLSLEDRAAALLEAR